MSLHFTSISWTEANDLKVVLATSSRRLGEVEASRLIGTITRIDDVPYVVHAVSKPVEVVGSGQAFLLRVGKLS